VSRSWRRRSMSFCKLLFRSSNSKVIQRTRNVLLVLTVLFIRLCSRCGHGIRPAVGGIMVCLTCFVFHSLKSDTVVSILRVIHEICLKRGWAVSGTDSLTWYCMSLSLDDLAVLTLPRHHLNWRIVGHPECGTPRPPLSSQLPESPVSSGSVRVGAVLTLL
jgi:hypothetical protein